MVVYKKPGKRALPQIGKLGKPFAPISLLMLHFPRGDIALQGKPRSASSVRATLITWPALRAHSCPLPAHSCPWSSQS